MHATGAGKPMTMQLSPIVFLQTGHSGEKDLFVKNTMGVKLQKRRKAGLSVFEHFKNLMAPRGCQIFGFQRRPQTLCWPVFTPI